LWHGLPVWETSAATHLYGALVVLVVTASTTALVCYLLNRTIGLRQSDDHELLGSDLVDHTVYGRRALALLEQQLKRPLEGSP